MDIALQLVATASSGIFSGAALYVAVVEHPARLKVDVVSAIVEFQLTYRRAAPLQATAAVLALIAGLCLALLTGRWSWAVGAAIVGSVIPLTLVVFMPTNRRLLGRDARRDPEASALLRRWGRLHWIRTVLGMIGFLVLLGTAFG